MAKIEYYTCDFCGAKVNDLTDLEPLKLYMDATTIHQEYEYQVCPWCFSTFSNTSTKDLFLEHLRVNFTEVKN